MSALAGPPQASHPAVGCSTQGFTFEIPGLFGEAHLPKDHSQLIVFNKNGLRIDQEALLYES